MNKNKYNLNTNMHTIHTKINNMISGTRARAILLVSHKCSEYSNKRIKIHSPIYVPA